MAFPYERYASLVGPLKTYYPAGQEELAQQIAREVEMAGKLLGQLLERPLPAIEIVLVAPAVWEFVPGGDEEGDGARGGMLPYGTDVTGPSTRVVPEQMDEIIGE